MENSDPSQGPVLHLMELDICKNICGMNKDFLCIIGYDATPSLSVQIYWLRVVECRLFSFRKLLVWLLYLDLKGVSVNPIYDCWLLLSSRVTVAWYTSSEERHLPSNGHVVGFLTASTDVNTC